MHPTTVLKRQLHMQNALTYSEKIPAHTFSTLLFTDYRPVQNTINDKIDAIEKMHFNLDLMHIVMANLTFFERFEFLKSIESFTLKEGEKNSLRRYFLQDVALIAKSYLSEENKQHELNSILIDFKKSGECESSKQQINNVLSLFQDTNKHTNKEYITEGFSESEKYLQFLFAFVFAGGEINYPYFVNNRTLLFQAIEEGYAAVVKILLLHPALNMNLKDYFGRTALHQAVLKENIPLVELLVADGRADIKTKDRNGITPLMSAQLSGNKKIVALLESKLDRII